MDTSSKVNIYIDISSVTIFMQVAWSNNKIIISLRKDSMIKVEQRKCPGEKIETCDSPNQNKCSF